MLVAAFDYVDSLHLVDDDVVLDGDGDGDIDNVSFVVKSGTGAWASILWPHMEYFPHDSIDHPVQINGIRPNTFNFEFEGSPQYFTAHVFRHEMGHSMDLPDLYHYINYDNVSPAGSWDMMCYNYNANHTAAIYKNKILHVCDDPIEITEDGDYTLLSVGSSPSRNCYYIKSSIDTTNGLCSNTAAALICLTREFQAQDLLQHAGTTPYRSTIRVCLPMLSSITTQWRTNIGFSVLVVAATLRMATSTMRISAMPRGARHLASTPIPIHI